MPFLGCAPSAFHVRARYRTLIVSAFCMACAVLSALAAPAAKKPARAKAELSSPKLDERLQALEDMRLGRAQAPGEVLWTAWETEKEPLVRVRLLQVLSLTQGGAALTELAAALRYDPTPMVRQAAAQELGRFASDARASQALLGALSADSAAEVRYACALGLALSDTPTAAAALEKAATDADPALRRQAAFSLKRHKSVKARQVLKKLEKDADPSVRQMAGAR